MNARDCIERFGLAPHPEGGWYREVFRSAEPVERAGDARSALTTIYFLLEAGQLGRWHVVESDEVWHFLAGEPMEVLVADPDATDPRVESLVLGPLPGDVPVAVVPARQWQASRPLGDFALVGCTVGPGFDFADFRFVSDLPSHQEFFSSRFAAFRDLL